MFSGCTVLPGNKETEFGSSDHKASLSAGKYTGVVLVPCSCMEVCPYSSVSVEWMFLRALGVIFYDR